ncbi:unnamed protein product [Linum trigynum]|uniref:GAG-pre-integrase domain-containing protein n=1 Tax=Linum trigynum TaxID=586398 RepID=A0AAV2EZE4_9ROSI
MKNETNRLCGRPGAWRAWQCPHHPHQKVYRNLQPTLDKITQGRKLESVYVMSAEVAYANTTRSMMTSLWHARFGHIGYQKFRVMMKKSMLKGLPHLDISEDIVCVGCQYGKARQLPYEY